MELWGCLSNTGIKKSERDKIERDACLESFDIVHLSKQNISPRKSQIWSPAIDLPMDVLLLLGTQLLSPPKRFVVSATESFVQDLTELRQDISFFIKDSLQWSDFR